MNPAGCDLHRHDFFGRLVDTQVQLTPGSVPTRSMLSNVPLSGAVHLQARGIHNHVPRPTARTDGQGRRQRTLSSTQSAVVWNWQIESQQLQERRNEALRRAKTEMEHRLQHQRTLDGRVGIDFRSAGTLGRVGVPPGGDGVLIEPKGQETPGDQRPIVVWPVAYSLPERVLIRRHSLCWHPRPLETSRHAEAIYATTRLSYSICRDRSDEMSISKAS